MPALACVGMKTSGFVPGRNLVVPLSIVEVSVVVGDLVAVQPVDRNAPVVPGVGRDRVVPGVHGCGAAHHPEAGLVLLGWLHARRRPGSGRIGCSRSMSVEEALREVEVRNSRRNCSPRCLLLEGIRAQSRGNYDDHRPAHIGPWYHADQQGGHRSTLSCCLCASHSRCSTPSRCRSPNPGPNLLRPTEK